MPPEELKKKLKVLGRKANASIPRLNCGGCGVFAAAVAKQLKRLGYEAEVIYTAYDDEDEFHEVLNEFKQGNWERSFFGGWLHHLAVRVKIEDQFFFYDSDNLELEDKPFHSFAKPGKGLTPEDAEAMANTEELWNSWFDRSHIPAVRRLVKSELKAA